MTDPAMAGVDGARFDVDGDPGRPWLTLLHPIGSSTTVWEALVPKLAAHHRVLRINFPGHGGRAYPGSGAGSLSALAADVLAVWREIRIERSDLFGLSLGGCVATAIALQAPERVASMIVACARLEMDEATGALWRDRAKSAMESGMDAIADATLARWLSDGFMARNPETAKRVRREIATTSAAAFGDCAIALSGTHLQCSLERLAPPTLFIGGRWDLAVPAALVRGYAAAAPGRRYAEIDAPHLACVEGAKGLERVASAFLSGDHR